MKKALLGIIAASLVCTSIIAIDNPHFYRANFFWQEPRLEEPWLSTFSIDTAGGSAQTGRNNQGHKVPILAIYGAQNMRVLGDTPGLDPSNPFDAMLINLAAIPARDDFGMLEFTGSFQTVEVVLDAYQNLYNGFFLQAYLPIRHLKIDHTNFYKDLSPQDGLYPNAATPQWVAFLNNFNAILKNHNLSKQDINENGSGDISILAGWSRNCQDFICLDFLDVSAKFGGLFPTGKTVDQFHIFDLPLGYNGFFGMPIKFDISIGYWEWLTAGMHIGALFLFETNKIIRMMNVENQSNYVMLKKGAAKIDPGTIWEVSAYLKADHIYRGLSLLIGYCFTQKDNDCIQPCDPAAFNQVIVNSNPQLHGWRMNVLHFMAEWDFTTSCSGVGPRLGFFYNYTVGGRRIFNTAIKDGYLGIDIGWCY